MSVSHLRPPTGQTPPVDPNDPLEQLRELRASVDSLRGSVIATENANARDRGQLRTLCQQNAQRALEALTIAQRLEAEAAPVLRSARAMLPASPKLARVVYYVGAVGLAAHAVEQVLRVARSLVFGLGL